MNTLVRLTKFHELNVSFAHIGTVIAQLCNVWYTEVHPDLLPFPVHGAVCDLGR